MDVGLSKGRIAAIKDRLNPDDSKETFRAQGLLVIPGLIDLHMHGYHLATPLGIPVDPYCLGRGVTTAVDAGSAGSSTFPGCRAFAAQPSRTRLLAFLHISCTGLSFSTLGGVTSIPGELDSLKLANVQDCVSTVCQNQDLIVGVKVRLSANLTDGGRNEVEALRRAKLAAQTLGLPLMTHHSSSTISHEECPGTLRPGDIYTHCYHGYPSGLIDPASRQLRTSVLEARRRGVLFDIGHGTGAFNWTVGELCSQQGFWPDTISSDLHQYTCEGPAYDLPTVMTRLLHLGMPLFDVIRATTTIPAQVIGWQDCIGSLAENREADVTILSLDKTEMDLEDCHSQIRRISQKFVPKAVWRAGKPARITAPRQFPNLEKIKSQRPTLDRLQIRDEHPVLS